jgi:DNA-binding CsgD family transcriptional regulator
MSSKPPMTCPHQPACNPPCWKAGATPAPLKRSAKSEPSASLNCGGVPEVQTHLLHLALDAMGPAFMVQADGTVLWLNGPARRISRAHELGLREFERLNHLGNHQRLRSLVDALQRLEREAAVLLECDPPVSAIASRLRSPAYEAATTQKLETYLIRLLPLKCELPATDLLEAAFGFTEKEAEVARIMAAGMTAQEAADERDVSKHTVATQVRHAVEKLGLKGQKELGVLIGRLGACTGEKA